MAGNFPMLLHSPPTSPRHCHQICTAVLCEPLPKSFLPLSKPHLLLWEAEDIWEAHRGLLLELQPLLLMFRGWLRDPGLWPPAPNKEMQKRSGSSQVRGEGHTGTSPGSA